MNDFEKNKIIKFANDTQMLDVVYKVLLDSFLKDRPQQDVYVLAASRLAIDFLKQGWKEIEKYKEENQEESKTVGNIGL